MRLILAFIFYISSCALWGQTPVLRPRPITIDLANPDAGLDNLSKEEKKKWKEIQKEKKKELKLQSKYYDYKLDSAQLAQYQKHQQLKQPSKEELTNLAKSQIVSPQLPIDLPDSVDISQLNDSSYFENLSPEVKKKILDELALYTSSYTQLSPDSLLQLKQLLFDSLGNSNDSAASYAQEQKKQMIQMASSSTLETQAQNQMSNYGPTAELATYQHEEDMMFDSYEEMIASDKYQNLMASMPGKKKEIESTLKDPNLNPEDLPIAGSVFSGHEKQLANAMSTQEVIRKKPSFKELLQTFFDQDMAGVQQESMIQRFSLTGQIQLSNYDPLFIDYSPSIAYAVTGKIRIGTGVTGRIKIGEGKDEEKKLFGYRGFMEYDIFKNIYLHGEYERTGMMVIDPISDVESRNWTDRWMLGLGTDIKMPGILKGTLLILYNFDDDLANSPNPRRFQVRYGVKLN
ncbi:hypothetical protein N7E81_01535 [Reichenbachiella carrageenanivorans]|uniref:Outer membrane protein beta-barrel domain-containing protein n=1 Tax=Reichenbachiella carrageenanivorans TaxID=2979869 RepID=A0ABY6D223_9BACT|nr:hypothetical protein [Reichenbachiella carrageenanivorans]UXX79789.1 hypothetical protein N7E81_01535 [Reichenbachiella carrageenanivorans]